MFLLTFPQIWFNNFWRGSMHKLLGHAHNCMETGGVAIGGAIEAAGREAASGVSTAIV